jgi:hypothetical protein
MRTIVMKKTSTKFGLACAALAALCMASSDAQAQCATCAVPQVAYSPVVYNNYTTTYDGWYLGKYIGRLGQRIFGPAPAPAYQAAYPMTYAASYPRTYAASYAPTYSYASYAPSCSTCGTSPCCCNTQTTYRPVIMQPTTTCATCYQPTCGTCNTCGSCGTCDACSGVTQATYDAPVQSSCPTCNTSSYVQSNSSAAAPSLPNTTAPPQTFRETDRINPIPAEESSVDDQNADWNAPMLLDPNDKITKRPTAPVWTAVYKKQASITSVSAAKAPVSKKNIGWTSGR